MKKMTIALGICAFTLFFSSAIAQEKQHEEQAVREVIDRVFRAMQLGDSAMLRSAFSSATTTARVFRDEHQQVKLRQENSIAGFLKAVGTPHKEVWNEEIWNVQIRIEDDFAQAWCDYAFYVGDTFSHCGVDAFLLYKDKAGWKIFHLADTQKKSGCEIPDEIQRKHKQDGR